MAFKIWSKPCPLCGAEECATFLQFYVRVRVYFGDTVYVNVKIARFLCNRLNPDVPLKTHRTFSLLPSPLIPYSPYALDVVLTMATTLSEHAENVYQTSYALASRYEHLNPDAVTLSRIKHRLDEAKGKLEQLSQAFRFPPVRHGDRGWNGGELSAFLTFVNNYHSSILPAASGACALSYDWFYRFQQDLPFMQRDFLFGTPSQKHL